MIPPGVRGDKRGWLQVRIMKMSFRKLLKQHKSDEEVMNELGLKNEVLFY